MNKSDQLLRSRLITQGLLRPWNGSPECPPVQLAPGMVVFRIDPPLAQMCGVVVYHSRPDSMFFVRDGVLQ